MADVAGQRLELRTVVVSGGRVLGLATRDVVVTPEPGRTDLAGDLRLHSGRALDGTDIWLAGCWQRISTIEVLAEACAWLGQVPVAALIDPRQWIETAVVLTLDVTAVSIRAGEGPSSEACQIVHLTDSDVCLLLQA